MHYISETEIDRRLGFDNPWWDQKQKLSLPASTMPQRNFFSRFQKLVTQTDVNRAVVLMGPRRVGKTIMVHHSILDLLEQNVPPTQLMYLSIETPIYTGMSLEQLLHRFHSIHGHERHSPLTVYFDEIQYLKDWEVHLKSLVDSYPSHRFVVTGSAAAALKLKSKESGAGRFTEFLLPALTFAEYLDFINVKESFFPNITFTDDDDEGELDIESLNQHFLDYMNFGGYPEAVFSSSIRNDSARYIKSDIIDKVLLRDLPSLYGITDIQELNRLFTALAYNSGNEVSLDGLSKASHVSKNTLKRYLEYLEAAFLIQRVYRVDQNAKRFQRATTFKVYLTNPSMRSALFGTLEMDDPNIGHMVETALFSQLLLEGQVDNCHYARWKDGEIDFVSLDDKDQKPEFAAEIKWSDLPLQDHRLSRNLRLFMKKHPSLTQVYLCTRSQSGTVETENGAISYIPSAVAAYFIGSFGFLLISLKEIKAATEKIEEKLTRHAVDLLNKDAS